jgi:low affinity Fe/Cu permease
VKRRGSSPRFTRLAKAIARLTGRPAASIAAFALVLGWACTGPVFGFSDTWQLAINTVTTIVTSKGARDTNVPAAPGDEPA